MMAAFAALSAVIQCVPFAPFNKRQIFQLATLGSLAGVAGAAVWLLAFNSRNWFWRSAAAAIVTLAICSVPSLRFPFWLNWEAWLGVLRMMLALTISIWISCWLFHMRGWRLVRGRVGKPNREQAHLVG
jgi:hypothetical protein